MGARDVVHSTCFAWSFRSRFGLHIIKTSLKLSHKDQFESPHPCSRRPPAAPVAGPYIPCRLYHHMGSCSFRFVEPPNQHLRMTYITCFTGTSASPKPQRGASRVLRRCSHQRRVVGTCDHHWATFKRDEVSPTSSKSANTKAMVQKGTFPRAFGISAPCRQHITGVRGWTRHMPW